MRVRIGVVGPHDLVSLVMSTDTGQAGAELHAFPYSHESEAAEVVTSQDGAVDGWLFTGPIPYFLSRPALTRPATYVQYSGSTLLTAVVRLLLDGRDVTRLSIDSLREAEVVEAIGEAGIPSGELRVLGYRPDLTSSMIADFHRQAQDDGYTAVTCVSSVYDALKSEMPCLRLAPSLSAIRAAATELMLLTTNQVNEDSHVVVGLVRADPPLAADDAALVTDAGSMSAFLATGQGGDVAIVTNRGSLQRATHNLTTSPFHATQEQSTRAVHIGFGMGHSASEAARLAQRAMLRAQAHKRSATVVSLRHDVDLTLRGAADSTAEAEASAPLSAGVLAARIGLSLANIERLQELERSQDGAPVTTRAIAAHLDVQMRTARRLVQRLELAGHAERVGQVSPESAGRPLTLYRLSL
ncbi:hypothetical protein [Agromyces silvae]|uniref:hypothetical protein n=1 Tax=Agromyces silvae TaxID=3388266 RepID=UPI00280B2114|nr:hypothetical protein [Agromyces protaetiae]